MATPKQVRRRGRFALVTAVLVGALAVAGIALGAVGTDQPDYSPGSTVTISGHNDSSGAPGYVQGATVNVAATNTDTGWNGSCSTTITASDGSWSCELTLSSDPAAAVGRYTYTGTSTAADGSPISEAGTFTDGNAASVTGTVTDSVTHVGISGATVTCTTTSGCNANFSATTDANGNFIFDASHNGKLTFAGTSGTLTLTASKTGYSPNTVTFSVSSTGGTYTSENIALTPSAPVNHAPTATVSLGSGPFHTNDTLTATATKSDADGDPVTLTYVWKVNGVIKKTTNATSSLTDTLNLLVAGNGDKGDTVAVYVTPNDGKVDGTTVSDSIVVADSPPTTPGAPTTSDTSPRANGNFTVSWTGSTDPDSDMVTYTLEQENQDGSGWHQVASGLAGMSYAFGSGGNPSESEGTWTFRVKASDGTADSGYATSTADLMKVDESAPNAPTVSSPTSSDYVDGTTNWYKDSVTVSFAGNGDPNLADGSAGSGVASVTASQTFSTAGAFSSTGYATDYAGNTSLGTTVSGNVDTAAPTVTVTCPSSPVILNSTAYATWTASDPGTSTTASGVESGEASGQILLDTSSVGLSETATAPAGTSHDNVGHASAVATCTYSVAYNFIGFLSPLNPDPTVVNMGNSGRTYPIKWQLTDANGTFITDGVTGTTISVNKIVCSNISGDTGDPIDYTASGGSVLRYDSTANQYIYNWATPTTKASCYRLTVTTPDGQPHLALFQLK